MSLSVVLFPGQLGRSPNSKARTDDISIVCLNLAKLLNKCDVTYHQVCVYVMCGRSHVRGCVDTFSSCGKCTQQHVLCIVDVFIATRHSLFLILYTYTCASFDFWQWKELWSLLYNFVLILLLKIFKKDLKNIFIHSVETPDLRHLSYFLHFITAWEIRLLKLNWLYAFRHTMVLDLLPSYCTSQQWRIITVELLILLISSADMNLLSHYIQYVPVILSAPFFFWT